MPNRESTVAHDEKRYLRILRPGDRTKIKLDEEENFETPDKQL
jgi:hypothetical protein